MSLPAGVSVVICCYNSIGRIEDTLRALSVQQVAPEVSWEIVVVDNCSSDGTAEHVQRFWEQISPGHTQLRIVEEITPGLNHAREKGIAESRYPYIIFCDDDNLLAPDYIENTKRLFDENSAFGIIGGNNYYIGNREGFVTRHYIHDYAIGEQAKSVLLEDITHTRGFVWGAGMCFRKQIFLQLKERNFHTLLTDRKGKELSSGGDAEFCLAARLLNWKIGASAALHLVHNVPDNRFQFDYLLRLKKGFGKAQPFLSIYDSLWTYKIGTPMPYSYKRELKQCIRSLFNKKRAVCYYLTGQRKENTTYVELHMCFAYMQTLFSYRSKLDKTFQTLKRSYATNIPLKSSIFLEHFKS